MNTIIIYSKEAAPEELKNLMGADDMYIIEGDFGLIGSVATRKEALEIANHYAAMANAQVVIEE